MTNAIEWLEQIKWNAEGLIPIIAQDVTSKEVLTQAWTNREAFALTVKEGRMVYWSRSRKQLWRKGTDSGHQQIVKEIRLDCDADALLVQVQQIGGIACHTGRSHCFYQRLEKDRWVIVDAVIKDPVEIYKNKSTDIADK